MPPEKVRLRIGNIAKAVLVSGQAYQDPKDALNEFVSNAADEYAQAGPRGGRIKVVLRRRGRHPVIAIDDDGRGMDSDRLRQVARSLFESNKAGDSRTVGEKAIGILAFQQLGGRCDIVTRPVDGSDTHSLTLTRGKATAELHLIERRRARQAPGTTIYISDLDPDVGRVLTQRKVVDYLRRRRGAALARGDYTIEVIEGRASELVLPEQPEGIKVDLAAQPTLWGRIEFALYVAADADRRHAVAVVGRGGTTIIDDLTELEELDRPPWSSGQISGQIVFESLQQTAGRRAILRDREAFPVFLSAVSSVEAAVTRMLERVSKEVDEATSSRLSEALAKVFGRVLRELADLDNPMRSAAGTEPGEGGLLVPPLAEHRDGPRSNGHGADEPDPLPELAGTQPAEAQSPPTSEETPVSAAPDRSRSRGLPSVAPDPDPGESRSRFDAESSVVLYNDRHADYLMVKDDDGSLLDYLATLVAKEYVVYNNPRATPDELAEEMVRMLVRVRRHLPKSLSGRRPTRR